MSIYDAFSSKLNTNDLSSITLQQKLAEYEQIKNANEKQPAQAKVKSPSFERLEDFAKSFSSDKNEWINTQTNVKEKRATMMTAFNDFIWANMYTQFDSYCEENKLPFCSDYVNSFIDQSKSYTSPIDQQNKTIENQNSTIDQLKKQVEALSKKGGELL